MADFFFPQIGEVELVEGYELHDELALFINLDNDPLLGTEILIGR